MNMLKNIIYKTILIKQKRVIKHKKVNEKIYSEG